MEDDQVRYIPYRRVIDVSIENTVSLHTGTFNFSTRNDIDKKKKKEEKDQTDFKPIFRRDRSLRKIDSSGRERDEGTRRGGADRRG